MKANIRKIDSEKPIREGDLAEVTVHCLPSGKEVFIVEVSTVYKNGYSVIPLVSIQGVAVDRYISITLDSSIAYEIKRFEGVLELYNE